MQQSDIRSGINRWWATPGEEISVEWVFELDDPYKVVSVNINEGDRWSIKSNFTANLEILDFTSSTNEEIVLEFQTIEDGSIRIINSKGHVPEGSYKLTINGLVAPDKVGVDTLEFRVRRLNSYFSEEITDIESLFVTDHEERILGRSFQIKITDRSSGEQSEQTVDTNGLIDLFKPVLKFDNGGDTEHSIEKSISDKGGTEIYANTISIDSYPRVSADSSSWESLIEHVDRDGEDWLSGDVNSVVNFSEYRDSKFLESKALRDRYKNEPSVVYASIVDSQSLDIPEDEIAINYWFHYPRSNWARHGGANTHQGDWEGITVFLSELEDGNYTPHRISFAQHTKTPGTLGGETVLWNDAVFDSPSTTNPNVYVGLGGHASYPYPGVSNWFNLTLSGNNEFHRGNGTSINPTVEYLPRVSDTSPDFLKYPGRWGLYASSTLSFAYTEDPELNGFGITSRGDDGPRGPVFEKGGFDEEGTRWFNPWDWASDFEEVNSSSDNSPRDGKTLYLIWDDTNLANTIDGGPEEDRIHGNGGNDTLSGGDGDDFLHGGDGDDRVEGGLAKDEIYGGKGNDFLDGGEDHDTIYDGAGKDYILSGTGNDAIYLETDGETDTIFFRKEDYFQRIQLDTSQLLNFNPDLTYHLTKYDSDSIKNFQFGTDILAFDTPVHLDVTSRGDGAIVLTHGKDLATGVNKAFGTGEFVAFIDNFSFSGNDLNNSISLPEGSTIRFSEADVYSTLDNSIFFFGSPVSDFIQSDGVFIFGADGDDIIQGGASGNTIEGGNGNDQLRGGGGNDTLIDTAGSNHFYGEDGNDLISSVSLDVQAITFVDGGNGKDYIAIDNTGIIEAHGGDGKDFIQISNALQAKAFGGTGDDVIFSAVDVFASGQSGSDVFASYGGTIRISDFEDGIDKLWIQNLFTLDQLRIETDIQESITSIFVVGFDEKPVFEIEDAESSIGIDDFLQRSIESLISEYLDRPSLEHSSDLTIADVEISEDADTTERILLYDFSGQSQVTANSTIVGRDASFFEVEASKIYLKAGTQLDFESKQQYEAIVYDPNPTNPYISGVPYNFTLYVADADDTLTASDNGDVIRAGARNDTIIGGNGWDEIFGEAGDDIIVGGPGKDVLIGGKGNDTYVYNNFDSRNIISDAGFSSGDVIAFGESIDSNSVTFQIRQGKPNDLDIFTGEAGDLVRVIGQFSENSRIEKFTFNDGTIFTWQDVEAILGVSPISNLTDLTLF